VPLCSGPASAAGPLHGASLLDPSKTLNSASLLDIGLANPSKTPGQETCGAHLHQDGGKKHQQAVPPISVDSDPQISVSVNRLLTEPDGLESARRTLLDNVKRRQRLRNSRAALYEPDTLLRNLHRCLLDPSKLEALVRREGLVEVRTNPDGAADGSFQASQRDMTGGRAGQLSGSDREVLEVLVTGACCQGQKVSTGLERLLPSTSSGMNAAGREHYVVMWLGCISFSVERSKSVKFGFARNAVFVLHIVAVCAASRCFGLCLEGDDEAQSSQHLDHKAVVHAFACLVTQPIWQKRQVI
jgi:hypothetical protein